MAWSIPECNCCCVEHTSSNCPAMPYGTCKGQETNSVYNELEWAEHYEKHHNMNKLTFFGYDDQNHSGLLYMSNKGVTNG